MSDPVVKMYEALIRDELARQGEIDCGPYVADESDEEIVFDGRLNVRALAAALAQGQRN